MGPVANRPRQGAKVRRGPRTLMRRGLRLRMPARKVARKPVRGPRPKGPRQPGPIPLGRPRLLLLKATRQPQPEPAHPSGPPPGPRPQANRRPPPGLKRPLGPLPALHRPANRRPRPELTRPPGRPQAHPRPLRHRHRPSAHYSRVSLLGGPCCWAPWVWAGCSSSWACGIAALGPGQPRRSWYPRPHPYRKRRSPSPHLRHRGPWSPPGGSKPPRRDPP